MRPRSESPINRPRSIVAKTKEAPGVSIRWTEAHHITFLRLGGSKWLREQVEKHMSKNNANQAQIS